MLTPEINQLFTAMIYKVKNTRSHLRAIDIHRVVKRENLVGIGQSSYCENIAIKDNYNISVGKNMV